MGHNYQLGRTKGASQSWRRTMLPHIRLSTAICGQAFYRKGKSTEPGRWLSTWKSIGQLEQKWPAEEAVRSTMRGDPRILFQTRSHIAA
jgi:hypothetical protein